jgi:hypothetical protein
MFLGKVSGDHPGIEAEMKVTQRVEKPGVETAAV